MKPRNLLKPAGLLVLLAILSLCLHFAILYMGLNVSIVCFCLPIFWEPEYIYIPLVILAFALIYWWTRKYRQIQWLQYFHIISLVFIPILNYLWAPLSTNIHFELETIDNAEVKVACKDCANGYFYMVNKVTVPLAIVLILGQIAFIVNIIVGFIRGRTPPHDKVILSQNAPPAGSYPYPASSRLRYRCAVAFRCIFHFRHSSA